MDARVKNADLDPVTLEVIRNALPATSNEMSADLQRTSYNMMIYEVRDFCTALLEPNGKLVAQNVGGVSHFVADLGAINGRIMSAESYAMLADLVDDPAAPLDEDVRPRVQAGRTISSRDYLTALAERERLKTVYAAATAGLDAVLTPTMVTPAIPIDTIDQNTTPGMLTRWVNFLDLCALAVPVGFTVGGLPLSLQIVCPGYEEATALRIGWAYQNSTDWHTHVPAMAAL